MARTRVSAEQRRLARVLTDENYGPALVRLSRVEQRTVLDLISANRGREARTTIRELDAARRARRQERDAARRTRPVVRPAPDWRRAAETMAQIAYSRGRTRFDRDQYVRDAEEYGTFDDWRDFVKAALSDELMSLAKAAGEARRHWSPAYYH